MDPTLIAALAAERHAELLRSAAAKRRVASLPRHARHPVLVRVEESARRGTALLRAWGGRAARATGPATRAEACCA